MLSPGIKACDIMEDFCDVIEASGAEAVDPEGPQEYAKNALTPWVWEEHIGREEHCGHSEVR